VRTPHISRVAGVAAAIKFWRRFKHENRSAFATRADGRTQGGIAATDDENIEFAGQIDHADFTPRRSRQRKAEGGCKRDAQ
jgi:hypothetical protein